MDPESRWMRSSRKASIERASPDPYCKLEGDPVVKIIRQGADFDM
jgi:hypothetical protein